MFSVEEKENLRSVNLESKSWSPGFLQKNWTKNTQEGYYPNVPKLKVGKSQKQIMMS